MIHLSELNTLTTQFAQCHTEPLRVTIHLQPNSRIVNYDPVHLDGLLARAVVERATEGRLLADSEDGYWIPLPLDMLWQSGEGYPLWASTVLYSTTDTIDDIYVRHKRNSGGEFHDKKKLVTRAGPWMERRIPTPTLVCDTLEALCIGNAECVKSLLVGFTHIGKLRLARVNTITVEPIDAFSLWRNGRLMRPMPIASGVIALTERPSLVGWTPPQWKPSLFSLGWPTGTFVSDQA